MLLFVPELMLHVSRPIRWDSDHVTIMDDPTMDLFSEIVRAGALNRVHYGLDYFDGTLNRIGAYVIGSRAAQKCMLRALLEPTETLRKYELEDKRFQRLALLEECKNLPGMPFMTCSASRTMCLSAKTTSSKWSSMNVTSPANDDTDRSPYNRDRRFLPVQLLCTHQQDQVMELGKLLDCAGRFRVAHSAVSGRTPRRSGRPFADRAFTADQSFNIWMTILFGALWGVGGLTFGLSMRYLGVALGQSIALGTCAGLGTIMGPVLLNIFFPENDPLSQLTMAVILGVVVTLIGIAIIGIAGSMKASSLSEEEKKAAVKDFNFPKGITIALLAGFMSGCFNVGLEFGSGINFGSLTPDIYKTLPATLLVTLGGFVTNAVYCFYQNHKNRTWGDYANRAVLGNNLLFCLLAGALVQPVLRTRTRQRIPDRLPYADDPLVLHPHGAQRGLLQRLGHNT